MNFKLFVKPRNKWLIGSIIVATAITGGIAIYGISQYGQVSQTQTSESVQTKPIAPKITALGRLEPEAEVIKLSAPLALDNDRVAKLLVTEGDRVKAGQVIAILDSRDRLQDSVQQAQEQVRVSNAKLTQVKAGAKSGEIQAQREQISRTEAELIGEI
ncbi:MAG: biotin/lipoyl-binding protein, partial [Xenococcaceae cyanobacterium]